MAFSPSQLPVATPSNVGVVKPDDRLIKITPDGTLSVNTALLSVSGGSGGGLKPILPGITPMPPPTIGGPPDVPGTNIDGHRPPGIKTIGKDHRFKIKKGMDLQGTNIINAVLIPTEPHELASKEYVDQVAAGGGGGTRGLTQAAADALYLSLGGGTLTGPLEVVDATQPKEAVSLGQVQSYFHAIPAAADLVNIQNPVDGALAFTEDTHQSYVYSGVDGSWISVTSPTSTRPTGGQVVSNPLPPSQNVGEEVVSGETTYVWNGFAWDRKLPVDLGDIDDIRADLDDVIHQEFIAPRIPSFYPNDKNVNDLNYYLDPGSFRILSAVNTPRPSGTLIVSMLGSGPGIGNNIAVEQIFFAWKEGTTAATIEAGDVFVRVGYGQVWSPWERINEQWIQEQINNKIGYGERFVGLYDADALTMSSVPQSVGLPYFPGNAIPDPSSTAGGVNEADYMLVTVASNGAIVDPNLPTNDAAGNPLELAVGDMLVNMRGVWTKVPGSGGAALPIDAVDISYDNTGSGMAATDAQAAIDELALKSGAWRDIFANNQAISAANTKPTLIASAPAGLMFDMVLHIEDAQDNIWMGRIVGGITSNAPKEISWSIAWEEIGGNEFDFGFNVDMSTVGVDIEITLNPAVDIKNVRGKFMAI